MASSTAHKHSFSAPSTINNRYPITPQRTQPSPSTSPCTPLSSTAYSSSNLTTPGSAYSIGHAGLKRLNFSMSPEVMVTRTKAKMVEEGGKEKSLADIAENWRSRANENGIRVSSSEGDADDEASERTNSSKGKPANDSNKDDTKTKTRTKAKTQSDNPLGPGYVPEETLLPPPFLSTHRRPRAHTQPQPPAHSQSFSFSSNSSFFGPDENGSGNRKNVKTKTCFLTPQYKSSSHPSSHFEATPDLEEYDSFSFSQDLSLDQGYTADQSFSSQTSSISPPSFLGPPMFPQTLRTPARRRPLILTAPPTQTHTHSQTQTQPQPLHSSNMNMNLYTPPQKNRSYYAEKVKLKGSLSEPPPRSRGRSRGGNGRGRGTELFDISEDYDYGTGEGELDDSLMVDTPAPVPAFPTYPYGYQHQEEGDTFYTSGQGIGLSDPFFSLPLPGAVEEREREVTYYPYACPQSIPFSVPPSHPHAAPKPATSSKPIPASNPQPTSPSNACSVCGRSGGGGGGGPKAILIPCSHPLCSACLTSALNIVGEKDMECSVCKCEVEDFKLVGAVADEKKKEGDASGEKGDGKKEDEDGEKEAGLLTSPFEFFNDVRARSSPPPSVKAASDVAENVVLRIDNVPWDITPPLIRAFFSNSPSLTDVHVLLDRRGKTLSHVFVEFNNEEAARAALRGAQKNSVLGKGKRARGVTVTRSGQEELMRSLFPSWKGTFTGSRPSLSGLPNPSVITTLETGLLTANDFSSLLHLIRSPDAHFLKVPSLPFHSLVSLLRKFPADCDSRVFWGSAVRDGLFEVLDVGLRVLLGRVGVGESGGQMEGEGEDMELVRQVFDAGVRCEAFTSQQQMKLMSIIDNTPYAYGASSDSPPSSPLSLPPDHPSLRTREAHCPRQWAQAQVQATGNPNMNGNEYAEPYGVLAREFGVEAELVQALAQRLAAF